MQTSLPDHDIVLVGAGHTNAHIIRMWRMHPIPGARLTCISDHSVAAYSGMLPGTLAGQYAHEEMQIDLVRLSAATGIRFIRADLTGLDVDRNELQFSSRPPLAFDVASIGVGSVPRRGNVDTTDPASIPVVLIKPMQDFLDRLDRAVQRVIAGNNDRPWKVTVVGAGVAGCEIAFCLPAHLCSIHPQGTWQIALIDRGSEIAGGLSPSARRRVVAEFERRGVTIRNAASVTAVTSTGLQLECGEHHETDLAIWVTGAQAPPVLANLGLPTDDAGFLRTRPTLQSTAVDHVFAVGDSGTIDEYRTPKAGVYAVRQGPVLWQNIKRLLADEPLVTYKPQRRFLKLLNTGDGRAVVDYNGISAHATWGWTLKDFIDRRFMRKYQDYAPMEMASEPPRQTTPRCLGCGGKIGASVLSRALSRLDFGSNGQVIGGIRTADDAAVVHPPADGKLVLTTDFFAAFLDDPYTVGRIAALNALSDAFAMGARPTVAMTLATLPYGRQSKQEQLLVDCLSGAMAEFRRANTSLVGGHTIEGPQFTIGFSISAEAEENAILWNSNLRPGDRLILTKPLGTGVLLAAHMQASCRAPSYDALLATMLASNALPVGFLERHQIRAATDVTGFGLASHLLEMLAASNLAAEIDLSAIPAIPGAVERVRDGVESTLAPSNRSAEAAIQTDRDIRDDPRYALLFDPQTSGGLLLAVPEAHAQAAADELSDVTPAGLAQPPAVVGRVTPLAGGTPTITIR